MTVISYSIKKDGEKQLAPSLKVKEFQCKSGADITYVDTNLVNILQAVADHFLAYVIITSPYRTPAYNVLKGSGSYSYHPRGQAADFWVKRKKDGKTVEPTEVAKYLETIGVLGIGCYPYKQRICHADTRTTKYFWKEYKSGKGTYTVSTHGGTPPQEDDDMGIRYNSVKDLPSWGKPTIEKLIKAGVIKGDGSGIDISEDMLRTIIFLDRMIGKIDIDVPAPTIPKKEIVASVKACVNEKIDELAAKLKV